MTIIPITAHMMSRKSHRGRSEINGRYNRNRGFTTMIRFPPTGIVTGYLTGTLTATKMTAALWRRV